MLVASGLLILGAAGVLAWDLAQRDGGPPVVAVTLGEGRPLGGEWAVPVRAVNRGGTTAADVRIEVRLGDGPDAPTAELDLPFLPRGSERHGWVTFDQPPAPRVTPGARVLGYGEP